MDVANTLASIGAFLSVVSNIPQVYKVRKPQSTNDLHVYSVLIHITAALLWSVYGMLLKLYILGVESFLVFLMWVLIFAAICRDRCINNDDVSKNEGL